MFGDLDVCDNLPSQSCQFDSLVKKQIQEYLLILHSSLCCNNDYGIFVTWVRSSLQCDPCGCDKNEFLSKSNIYQSNT